MICSLGKLPEPFLRSSALEAGSDLFIQDGIYMLVYISGWGKTVYVECLAIFGVNPFSVDVCLLSEEGGDR